MLTLGFRIANSSGSRPLRIRDQWYIRRCGTARWHTRSAPNLRKWTNADSNVLSSACADCFTSWYGYPSKLMSSSHKTYFCSVNTHKRLRIAGPAFAPPNTPNPPRLQNADPKIFYRCGSYPNHVHSWGMLTHPRLNRDVMLTLIGLERKRPRPHP